MGNFDWQTDLSPEDRRTLILALAYERARNKTQFNYKVFDLSKDPTQTPLFKCFRTVQNWFESQSLHISSRTVTWEGYVSYLFKALAPSIPQPGQLKNPVSLAIYCKSSPSRQVKSIRAEKLEQLYRKVIVSEFRNDAGLLEMMGLRNIRLFEEGRDGL